MRQSETKIKWRYVVCEERTKKKLWERQNKWNDCGRNASKAICFI